MSPWWHDPSLQGRPKVSPAGFTHWILLFNPTPGPPQPDGEGGYVDTFQPCTPPGDWASIDPAPSNNFERALAGTVASSVTHEVGLRYRPDIDMRTQITFVDRTGRSRKLWVRAIENPRQGEERLVLGCEEKLN